MDSLIQRVFPSKSFFFPSFFFFWVGLECAILCCVFEFDTKSQAMGDVFAPAKHFDRQGQPPSASDAAGAMPAPACSLPSSSTSGQLKWSPAQLAFCPYSPPAQTVNKPQSLRVVVRKPLLARLTRDIVETYQTCNPKFKYTEELNPKRYLTTPAIGVLNDGFDNANSDLILSVNYALVNLNKNRRYIVKDILGHGTFGQVAKCWDAESNNFVAIKIIKNQPAYYQQALVEVSILTMLNTKHDPEDQHHIVRIFDCFQYQQHLCISFELLNTNLFELIKLNNFRGLSLSIVQLFSKQILCGMALLKDAGIIHCDLKPENILLSTSVKPPEVKIIDFGSACMENRTVYSYIQSRYYRSPEVLLGYQYTTAIDMWSLGCIVAELFLGLPLFPGASEFDLLKRMIEILGAQPPDHVLKESKNTSKYFKCIGSVHLVEPGEVFMGGSSAFQALTEEEYEARELKKPTIGKEYFNHMSLEAIVKNYPYRKNLHEEDIAKECQIRVALIDFLKGLVEFDPAKRWSPFQASKHPFVTGEPFTCPYRPPMETARVPVSQNVKIDDHHPGGGHWFAAGLSPNIAGGSRAVRHCSPHFQMMIPHTHASSYGSLGSHGSCNDGAGLGNSYGSYGDNSTMFMYFSPVGPSGMNMHPQGGMSTLGTSPDTRWRFIQRPPGHGLGVSPSAGNFASLPLGTSPSQFTSPNSFSQFPAGSPGHYGPTSPAKGSCHGSPLGKMTATSHYSRRKSSGFSGNVQSQECTSFPHWKGHLTDDTISSQTEVNSQAFGGYPLHHLKSNSNAASWKPQRGGIGIPTISNLPGSATRGGHSQYAQTTGTARTIPEDCSSVPDPGDWDPNYSEEQLLEDCSEANCLASEFGQGMHINQGFVSNEPLIGVGRFSVATDTSSSIPIQRTNGHLQGHSCMEASTRPSGPDLRAGYSISKPRSYLGQQPVPRFNPGRSTAVRGSEWNHMKLQPPTSNFLSGGPRSPGNSSLGNGMPWGRRGVNIPPTSHARKDYGRIA